MRDDLTTLVLLETRDVETERLRALCPKGEVRLGPWLNDPEHREVPSSLLKGVQVLLCELLPSNFEDFDRLEWIHLASAGYAQVLGLPLLERGIRVTNGLGNFDIPIAEWNVMMMLMCHRHMPEMQANQRQAHWDRAEKFQAELRGATVGLYGYGGIGRETARLAKAMGLNVWALTRDGGRKARGLKYSVSGSGDPDGSLPDRVFGPAEIEVFLQGVDFLIVAMPLTDATRGLVGEEELRLLKPTAVLLNPARAEIIDEQALLKCLREGWIRAAAIDVHYAYPLPPEHPLWLMPNVILTPHISGSAASTHFLERVYDMFTQNVDRYRTGQPLLNELTESQLRGE